MTYHNDDLNLRRTQREKLRQERLARQRKLKIILAVAAVLVLLAGAYYLYSRGWSGDHLGAATAFFNAPATRLIPLWGWLKALVVYAFAGNAVGTLTAALALILAVPLLFFVIRHTKADFYEEAMARSDRKSVV